MQLSKLTDGELARHAWAQRDPLTSTELEAELLRRFEEQEDVRATLEPLSTELEGYDLDKTGDVEKAAAILRFGAECDPSVYRPIFEALSNQDVYSLDDLKPRIALLEVLTEFDIDDPAVLRKQLDRIAKFDQAMQDLAAPLATLQTLSHTE